MLSASESKIQILKFVSWQEHRQSTVTFSIAHLSLIYSLRLILIVQVKTIERLEPVHETRELPAPWWNMSKISIWAYLDMRRFLTNRTASLQTTHERTTAERHLYRSWNVFSFLFSQCMGEKSFLYTLLKVFFKKFYHSFEGRPLNFSHRILHNLLW